MAVNLFTHPDVVVSTNNEVAYEKPETIYADTDYSTPPPKCSTALELMESLKSNGPLVAEGRIGPGSYLSGVKPFKTSVQFLSKAVYGWKKGSEKSNTRSLVILLGVKKIEERAYVFFSMACEKAKDAHNPIHAFQPNSQDAKIYVVSFENFYNYLFNIHPICPGGNWLYTENVSVLLDGGEGEAKCKKIGQQIFDHYKAIYKNDSFAARDAVVRICEAARFVGCDSTSGARAIRSRHIESAWHEIGDRNFRWMA